MRFCIHRAASQVGGNCIEVQSGDASILLDLGLPLGAKEASATLLPDTPGIGVGSPGNLLAVVLSHPHQDHYGLLSCANPHIPVYLGAGADKLLRAAAFFTASARIPQKITTYEAHRPFRVGPFTVTPYPVDHSAYDAYSLLIEADGKRLLYSGDFRLHGRKSRLMGAMLKNPPREIDVLLMEGTLVGREDAEEHLTEAALERTVTATLKRCRGLALASFSPQNIDRLVTFYRAVRQADRVLVVDAYTAHMLEAIGLDSLPSARNSEGMRVFLPLRQKMKIVREGRFDLIEPFRRRRIFMGEINSAPRRYVCLYRPSMEADFTQLECLPGATLLYSLWPGYLRRQADGLSEWAERNEVTIEVHHTSGHAYVSDLSLFTESIKPKKLVPIHTGRPTLFSPRFRNVLMVPDGAWQEV